jgi:hypothetical protein
VKDNKLQQTLSSEEALLSSTLSTTSSAYSAPKTRKQDPATEATAPPLPAASPVGSAATTTVPSYYDQSKVVSSSSEDNQKKVIQNQNPEQFNLLASALFSASGNDQIDQDPFAPTSGSSAPVVEEEVLRLPNRSVTVTKSKKEKAAVSFAESQPEVLRATPASAATGTPPPPPPLLSFVFETLFSVP